MTIASTQKKAKARVKKQCDNASNLKTNDQRIKENLEKVLGKPIGGYYTINGVRVTEAQVMSCAKGNTGTKTPDWLDQVIKGSYSDKTTTSGTIAEILVGGIPIIGDIGDARDALHGIQNGNWWEVGAAGLGFIPIVRGLAKEGAQSAAKEGSQSLAKKGAQSAVVEEIPKRPSWKQSDIDAEVDHKGYDSQKSFLNGEEVTYGTKGSSRPELYKQGHSIEVKNYNVQTSSGQNNLINNVSKQIKERLTNLPNGANQTILIDVRGQNVTNDILKNIRSKILEKSGVNVEIIFKR